MPWWWVTFPFTLYKIMKTLQYSETYDFSEFIKTKTKTQKNQPIIKIYEWLFINEVKRPLIVYLTRLRHVCYNLQQQIIVISVKLFIPKS
jgi:hypothetical protein